MSGRADAFLDRLERLSVDDLEVLALEPIDRAAHDRLLDAADAAALAAGRLDELDQAADRANEAIVRALSGRSYDPTWFGLNWGRTLGRVEDRAQLIGAVEDAAIAAVVADLVPSTADALAAPFERLAGMAGTGLNANPISTGNRTAMRLLWIGAAVALLGSTLGFLIDLAAEYAPSYLFG